MAKIGRPKKIETEEKKPEEPKFSCPFKKGEIYSDMKIVDIVPDSVRPVHFKLAKRGEITSRTGKNEVVAATNAVMKDPLTGKVIWDDYIHMMTVEDFAVQLELKRKTQKDVE